MLKHVIFLEISGKCSAHCLFCITGQKGHNQNGEEGFVDLDLFRKILKKISLEFGEVQINLYNWGEPFLHPQFKEVIYEILKYPQFTYGLSTNCSVYKELDGKMISKLAYLRFSLLGGFSQESYDKISKLNFEAVLKNIETHTKHIRSYSDTPDIYADFHIYKFNEHEIEPAKAFCEKLGINIRILYATINDLSKIKAYFSGTISPELKKEVEENLYIEHYKEEVKKKLQQTGITKECSASDILTISPSGNVMTGCCAIYGDPNFVVGKYLDLPLGDIEVKTKSMPICNECFKLGLNSVKVLNDDDNS